MEVSRKEAQNLSNDIAERLYYIAKLNPRGVNKLATKYGYPAPKENINSKFNFLNRFFIENGGDDQAIDELMFTHPDFQMFAETVTGKINRSRRRIPVEEEVDSIEDGYMNIQHFGNYDGFMSGSDTYNDDKFIGGIISAVGNLGAAGVNKIGAGKDRASAERLAKEQTKQAGTGVQIAAIQAKQAKKEAEEKRKTTIIIAIVVLVVIGLAVGGYFLFRKK